MNAPALAAITLDPTGGGVALVSRLLWRALGDQFGDRARLLTMFDHESRPASLAEKARFTTALTGVQISGRADWVMFSHLGLAQVQNAIPRPLRRPYGVFLHGIEVWKPLSLAEQWALEGADLRLANSHFTARRVMEMHPHIGKVEACPLALVPRQTGDAAGGSQAIPALGPHAVLMVGRLLASEQYKGHDQLIEAWPRVLAAVPDAQLVIVGDGDDGPRLKQKAIETGSGSRICFTGFLSNDALEAVYEKSALFALPSRGEGFGLVYLEAMAHRLPCIGSVHDAAGEVIADGETGRLVSQDDTGELVRIVSTLLLNEDDRRRMGEAGYRRLQSEFTFDRFSARLQRLLGEHTAVSAAVAV